MPNDTWAPGRWARRPAGDLTIVRTLFRQAAVSSSVAGEGDGAVGWVVELSSVAVTSVLVAGGVLNFDGLTVGRRLVGAGAGAMRVGAWVGCGSDGLGVSEAFGSVGEYVLSETSAIMVGGSDMPSQLTEVATGKGCVEL